MKSQDLNGQAPRCILEARQLHKQYRRGRLECTALETLDLHIFEGEMLCIMGPSGSGKTTLLNLLGLLDTPSGGELLLKDSPTQNLNYREAARLRSQYLSFIFQSFNLFPVLTAYENVEYPLLSLNLDKDERRDRVWQALSDVHLREVALHRPDELSGGQQQRVAIARALVIRPLLILADEPTASLDSHSTEIVMEVMRRLNAEKKTTFVFSTHDPRVVNYATRTVHLKDGAIADDSLQNVVSHLSSQRLSQ